MHITPSGVLRRMAGVATAALLLLSTTFILDNETSAVVAGRQVSNDRGHSATAPGRFRQSTTTAASATTALSDGSSTSIQNTSTSIQNTSTIPTTTGQAPTSTVAPTTTASAGTTTTGPKPKGGKFTIHLGASNPGRKLWSALYLESLPFTPDVGWADGERVGYDCAWMFLLRNGQVVGRATFLTLDGEQGYGRVNDQSMTEKSRYYDGTPSSSGTNLPPCPDLDQAYEPSAAPDERPTLRFVAGSDLLEVRDYKKTLTLSPGITFDQVSVINEPFDEIDPNRGTTDTVYSRIVVIGREYGLPVVVVYYDSLDPSVAVISDLP